MSSCLNTSLTVSPSASSLLPPGSPQTAHARDHRIAQSLQRVLLRTCPPEALPGLATAAFYEAILPEASVGGDSYDAFALSGERIALAIVDASGKGLAAAERVAEIRFALRAFLQEHGDPGQALSCLNDFVCDSQRLGRHDDSTFATLTLVVLDTVSGKTNCLCAGGEPPLVLRANGTVEVVPIYGAALGVVPNQEYSMAALDLEIDDALLLVTDGLTEARNLASVGDARMRTGALLGLEGLIGLAAKAHRVTLRDNSAALSQTGRAIFEGARAFAGGSFHDDTCLFVAQRQARSDTPA